MTTQDSGDRLSISGALRDLVANVLGHTAGPMVREGERLRPLLPVESAAMLRELMSLERAADTTDREEDGACRSGGGAA